MKLPPPVSRTSNSFFIKKKLNIVIKRGIVLLVWQHPFVDVLKQISSMQMTIDQDGDVTQTVVRNPFFREPKYEFKFKIKDKTIRKNVFRIKGSVAASNYIQVPKYVFKKIISFLK